MNRAKKAILAGITNAETRAGMSTWPGRYFQVAVETVDDPEDLEEIVWRIIDLYGQAVHQLERQAAAAETKLAEHRRHGLRAVTEHPPAPPATTDNEERTKP